MTCEEPRNISTLRSRCRSLQIIKDSDDAYCDLSKALRLLAGSNRIVIVGEFTGRLDQVLGNFSCALSASSSECLVMCVADDNIAVCLPRGNVRLQMPDECQGWFCGYFPMCGASTVSTQGLLYDVSSVQFAFGHFVSSSNQVRLRFLCHRFVKGQ